MLRKIFSWFKTHQGPIFALVYTWYTNTEYNRWKEKMNALVHRRTLKLLCSYQEERILKNAPSARNIHIFFLEQAVVEGLQKWKKLTWWGK